MDPINYRCKEYNSLTEVTADEVRRLAYTKNVVLYNNLVVDLDKFSHPGSNRIIDQFKGKDISQAYNAQQHSLVADMILCQRTINKVQGQSGGEELYTKTTKSQMAIKHQQIMSKFNFNNPLLQELTKFKADQLQILVQIPKFFKNPNNISFARTELKDIYEKEYFWVTLFFLISYIFSLMFWMRSQYQTEKIIQRTPFIFLGMFTWTGVEYIFHRFLLHPDKLTDGVLRAHLIHHSFPNLDKKVALGIGFLTFRLAIAVFLLSFLIDYLVLSMMLMGFLFSIVCYDSIHYYCHFGPQLNISWLNSLRINHLKHHYRCPNKNFGVTSPLWDYICGTYSKKIQRNK